MGQMCGRATGSGRISRDEKLLKAVHLQLKEAPLEYSDIDPLWRHPQTGAMLYVGNMYVAQDRELLKSFRILRIVNCQDRGEGSNCFEDDPDFTYLRFQIGKWREVPGSDDGGEATWRFWEPLFTFVTEGLRKKQNVFIHCLTSAHRAGTAAIGLLMLLCRWDAQTATCAAMSLRPAIEMIDSFPQLLALLDRALVGREKRVQILLPDVNKKGKEEEEEIAAKALGS